MRPSFFLPIFFIVVFPAAADTAKQAVGRLVPQLSETAISTLISDRELSRFYTDDTPPELAPVEKNLTYMRNDLDSIGYTVGVETLYLLPEREEQLSALELCNALLRLSELSGLHYYSASRDTMRILFVESYTVAGPESTNRAPDPRIGAIPASGTAYLFQEDKTFGKNISKLTFEATEEQVHVLIANETPYYWGPFRIIRAGEMHLHIYVIPDETVTLYYATFGAQALKLAFFRKRIFNSFYNRLEAMYQWYREKLAD